MAKAQIDLGVGGGVSITSSECQYISSSASGTITISDCQCIVVLGQSTAGAYTNCALVEKNSSQTITNYTGNSLTASLSADGKTITYSQSAGYNFIVVILK